MLQNPMLATVKGWTEHVTPEGRKFYFNSVTRTSQWEKPNELKTADELQSSSSAWREYTTPEGRKYYHNSITGISTWNPPDGKLIFFSLLDLASGEQNGQAQGTKFIPTSTDKAEEAFMQLLAEKNVDQSWEWEQVLRESISHPSYRAIDSMPRRKAVFLKYLDERKKFEREERERSVAMLRADFFKMFEGHFSSPFDTVQSIRSKMNWRRVLETFGNNPVWKAMPSDKECERCWDEWLAERRKTERKLAKRLQKENLELFNRILRTNPQLVIDLKWRRGVEIIEADECYLSNPNLSLLEPIDKLIAWEEHVKELERKYFDKLQYERMLMAQKEVQSRADFSALLDRLVNKGTINGLSKWKNIFPLIRDEPEFLAMLGNQQGSSPLDLFFDVVDRLEQQLDSLWNRIQPAFESRGFYFSVDTSLEQFLFEIKTTSVDCEEETARLIYAKVSEQLKCKKIEQQKLYQKRLKQAKKQFKICLSKLYDRIDSDTTWEQIKEHIPLTDKSELSEELQIAIFNKVHESIKRQIQELGEREEGEVVPNSEPKRYRLDESSELSE